MIVREALPSSCVEAARRRSDPFHKFLFCVASHAHELVSDKIKLLSRDRRLSFSERTRWGGKLMLAHSGKVNGASESGLGCLFSGVANIDGTLAWGEVNKGSADPRLPNDTTVGLFTLLNDTLEDVVISTDYFGLCHIFIYRREGVVLVSNDYQLVVRAMRSLGVAIEINLERFAALTAGDSAMFHQPVGPEMDVMGVVDVPVDHYVLVQDGKVRLARKESFTRALEGIDRPTESLWDNAISEVCSNVDVILGAMENGVPALDLSGGLDSRLCLAAVLHRGHGLDGVIINSQDVPGSKDLDIACGLVNLYGGEFDRGAIPASVPRSVDEALNSWFDHFTGLYYRLGVGPWKPDQAFRLPARIAGGCGEIYRGFWSKVYGRHAGKMKSYSECAAVILDEESTVTRLGIRHYDLARGYMAGAIEGTPGVGVVGKLDNSYIFHRNRCHFGAREYSFRHERPVWFPLMSPSLFRISNAKHYRGGGQGHALFELLQRINPLLARLPYDDGFRGAGFLKPDSFASINLQLNYSRESWEAAGSARASFAIASRPKTSSDFNSDWKNIRSLVYEKCVSAIQGVLSDNAGTALVCTRAYQNYLHSLYSSGSPRFMVVAAKILSVESLLKL